VVVPGVGAFATVAEAYSFIEDRSWARRRGPAGPADRASYPDAGTEPETVASDRGPGE
jgi:hypothetical protein